MVSEKTIGYFGMMIVNIGIFVSLMGSAAGEIITLPRLILALARDKLFITQFSSIHEKFNTPYKAIIFQTIVSLLVFGMAFGSYDLLLRLMLPLGLIMYFFVILSVPLLRKKEPQTQRHFKKDSGLSPDSSSRIHDSPARPPLLSSGCSSTAAMAPTGAKFRFPLRT